MTSNVFFLDWFKFVESTHKHKSPTLLNNGNGKSSYLKILLQTSMATSQWTNTWLESSTCKSQEGKSTDDMSTFFSIKFIRVGILSNNTHHNKTFNLIGTKRHQWVGPPPSYSKMLSIWRLVILTTKHHLVLTPTPIYPLYLLIALEKESSKESRIVQR